MSTVTVKVKQTTKQDTTGFEGTVQLQGTRPTKLVRKDGTTLFPTTSALKSSARAFAKRINATVEYDEPAKKAAKTSVKSKTSKTTTPKKTTAKKTTTKKKTKK